MALAGWSPVAGSTVGLEQILFEPLPGSGLLANAGADHAAVAVAVIVGAGVKAKKKPPSLPHRSGASDASSKWISGTTSRSTWSGQPSSTSRVKEMNFIAVTAWLDIRYDARPGSPIAEFS